MVAAVLIGIAIALLLCLGAVSSLWGTFPDANPANPGSSDDPWKLSKLVKSFRDGTKRSVRQRTQSGEEREIERSMDPEEALLLAIRTRGALTAGLLGIAALLAICATVITCAYIKASEGTRDTPPGKNQNVSAPSGAQPAQAKGQVVTPPPSSKSP